jgi:hypothetical protein
VARQFEDYPPEFDFDARELQRYGITKIWAAFHNPDLRAALYREWRGGHRSFSAWVIQQVYAQKRAKNVPSRHARGSTKRPHWRARYADELAASPALLAALSGKAGDLGQAFSRAGLSNQETTVMRRLLDGAEPTEVIKELQMSKGNFWNVRERALSKFKAAFVVPDGLVREGTIAL